MIVDAALPLILEHGERVTHAPDRRRRRDRRRHDLPGVQRQGRRDPRPWSTRRSTPRRSKRHSPPSTRASPSRSASTPPSPPSSAGLPTSGGCCRPSAHASSPRSRGPQPPSPALVQASSRPIKRPAEREARRSGQTPARRHPRRHPSDAERRTAVVARSGQAVPLRRAREERLSADPTPPRHLAPYKQSSSGASRAADGADDRRARTADAQRATSSTTASSRTTSATSGQIGRVMLGFSLVQIVFSVGAVYLGGRVAMGFGRDLRNSLFHKVTNFSAREVEHDRRAVADHAHHQRRAADPDARRDGVHDGDLGADHDGRRRDHGAAPGRRPVGDPRWSRCPSPTIVLGVIVRRHGARRSA